MTVGDLKERLEDLDEDMEVRLMTQPAWPFEYSIADVRLKSEISEGEPDEEKEEKAEAGGEQPDVLYLIEGSQLGYGTKQAWR